MADVDTYPDSSYLDGSEKYAAKRGSGAVRVLQTRFPYLSESGVMTVPASAQFLGGFGAISTVAGQNDWGDISNARSGCGMRLLSTGSTDHPPRSGYFHPFNFEYSQKNGGGNMTQFAIPYQQGMEMGYRIKLSGSWYGWQQILCADTLENFIPWNDNSSNLGNGSKRFANIYATNATIQTSDERQKHKIGPVSDTWLDAWGGVEWVRYQRKNGDRWHVGLIAQRVYAAFEKQGLDAFEIGLIGFDKWEAKYEDVLDEEGNPKEGEKGPLVYEAGDLWSLRYEECLAMEAAYVRREMERNAEENKTLRAALEKAGLLK